MKKIILSLILLATSFGFSQNSSNNSLIELNAYVPEQIEGMSDIAINNLENKLNQIVTTSGLGTTSESARFILTANIDVLTKDITPTAPPMHAITLNVNLIIGDGIEGIKFSTQSIVVKGVGENETKAYLAALKSIKANDPQYQTFIEKGKAKIIDYYTKKCDFIIKEAKSLAVQNQYDSALFELNAIPQVCTSCYDKVSQLILSIYKQKKDKECKILLADATNAWNASQNEEGASIAAEYLGQIDPNASCINEVKALTKKIGDKILSDNKKEWDFKLKVYNDQAAYEREYLKAAKEIAVAYANTVSVSYNVIDWY